MMGYDLDTNEFMSKGEGVDVKALGRKSQVKGVTDTRLSVSEAVDQCGFCTCHVDLTGYNHPGAILTVCSFCCSPCYPYS